MYLNRQYRQNYSGSLLEFLILHLICFVLVLQIYGRFFNACMYACVTYITDAACTLCNIILLLFVKIKQLKHSL